jgi:hypothetical protein
MVDGSATAEFGIYDLKGQWVVENEGVAPDIELDNLPADLAAGRDPQLQRAVAEVLKQIEAQKPVRPPPPPSKDLRRPEAPRRCQGATCPAQRHRPVARGHPRGDCSIRQRRSRSSCGAVPPAR